MKVLAELHPLKSFEKLAKIVHRLEDLVDGYDVPDAPLGLDLPSAPVLAARLRCVTTKPLYVHLRVVDHTTSGILYLARGLEAVGADALVLLRGDRPVLGDALDKTSEDVAKILRSRGLGLRIGGLLSLRKPLRMVLERLESKLFDFMLVLRAVEVGDDVLEEVSTRASRLGVRLYAYIIVGQGELPGNQPVLNPAKAAGEAARLSSFFDGFVVSYVGSVYQLPEAVKAVRKGLKVG